MLLVPQAPEGVAGFNFPTAIRFGPGAIAELSQALADRGVSKALIVTDGGLLQTDAFARVKAALGDTPHQINHFEYQDGIPDGDAEASGERYTFHGTSRTDNFFVGVGQRPEELGRNARLVGHVGDRDLRLAHVVHHGGDDGSFHP